MPWHNLDNKQKIIQIINHLITKKTELKILIEGEETVFTSQFIKITQKNTPSKAGNVPELIIEKLYPETGNTLIQSSPKVVVEFLVNKNTCRCHVEYIGASSTYPDLGFIVSFPESIEIKEKRREDRFVHEMPEFVSASFRLGKGTKNDKTYNLNVHDYSRYGLGLLITKDDFDLLQILKKGDKLQEINFYATWAMIKVDGVVRHMTKIKEGKHKGCYLLGIESSDIIESGSPNKV